VAENRLTGSDKRTLLLWIILGVVGAVFAQRYFFRAFPEASVDFHVSRGQAIDRAKQFVASVGENVSGYETAVAFEVDDNAKTYLEREVGLQQANQLMSHELNIWYWDVRFFRPQQEEEFHVRVSPGGQVVGYDHKVKEASAGAALERAAAEKDAQDFLSGKLGVDLSKWDFLAEEANSSKKPNRTDWSFTWEKHGFRAKDAPYRLRVTLAGDRAGSAEEFLHVPEAWERSYEKLRSTNTFYNVVAFLPWVLLLGSALWIGIALTKQGQTNWAGPIKLGIVVAILLTFMQLNNWQLDRMGYDTNTSYGSFVFGEIGKALLFGLFSAITVVLPIPGGEPLYRAAQKTQLRLAKAFTLRGMRTKEFFKSATIGISMAAAHIGFIVAFYIVANHFGAWAPQEVDYENSVNTAIPWISGVAIGMLAATSEEFLFRLFAIPFMHRLTGSRVVAVVVPAFCWSFLHSAYPNEPPYIRGLEVGLIGIVAGIVMLRWGILTTVIWHYTVDASLVGLLLIRSNNLYFKVSGVIVGAAAVAPLLFSAVAYLQRGQFEADEDLLNSAQPIEKITFEMAAGKAATAAKTRRYDALTPTAMLFLAVCLVFGGLAAWRVKTPKAGDYLKLSVNPRTVKERADEILRQHGQDPKSYRKATIFAELADPVTNEFLRRRGGIALINEVYGKEVPVAFWQVRYFRDGDAEEFSIKLGPDGGFLALNHKLSEDAAGATLSKEEAIAKAEKYLTEVKKIDLSRWTMVEADSDKRIHRTDHELCWQRNAPLDGEPAMSTNSDDHAYERIKIAVLGDEVVDYRGSYYAKPEARDEQEANEGGTTWSYIKIPDEWRRKQEELTLGRTSFSVGMPIVFLGGLGITAIVMFFKNLKSEAMEAIPWKRAAFWAALMVAGYLLTVTFGNVWQERMNMYQTAMPMKTMVGILVIGILIGLIFYIAGTVSLFGLASYFSNRAYGEERLPVGARMPANYYRDAVWIGVCGAAGLIGLQKLIEVIAAHWPAMHRSYPIAAGANFDAALPSAAAVGGALTGALYFAGLIVFIAAFVGAVAKARWMRFGMFLLGALFLTGGNWQGGADFAKQFVAEAIILAVIVFGVRRIVRFNVLGYVLLVACIGLAGAAAELLGQPEAFYRTNGYAVLMVIILMLLIPLAIWRMRSGETAASDGGVPGGGV